MPNTHRPILLIACLAPLLALGCCKSDSGGNDKRHVETRSPFPDDRIIDSLTWSFSPLVLDDPNAKLPLLGGGPAASLTISREGKVHYWYASAPNTGSGGRTIVKDWQI